MTPAEAYAFLFERPPTPETLDLLTRRGRDYPIASLTDARRLLMALDRAEHPTRAHVRLDAGDMHTVQLDGFTMVVDVADLAISNHIVAGGVWEPALTAVFRRYLRPGMHVADIGANVGYFTLLARSLVGPGGHVHAFEPNGENARLILINLARNGFDNVSMFPLALADRTGHAVLTAAVGSNGTLDGPASGPGSGQDGGVLEGGGGMVVPTMRLDDLVQGPLDFIKMDAEGAEHRVLRGAVRLMATGRPAIATEFSCRMLAETSGVEPRAFLALVLGHGYAVHLLDPDTHRLTPVPDVDAYLAGWGEGERVDSLLLLPAGAPVIQP